MTEVISVRFRGGAKTYYFDPNGLTIQPDQYVVVETSQGLEYVCCVEGNHEVSDQSVVQPLRPVIRLATEADHKTAANNIKREKEAFSICEKKIADHKLEMKLVNVECNFEGSKIIFFFTAEGRVDFRELVKDLASIFRARIELRQIGVRDEAKMLGGLGICGRPLCCSQFLEDFIPVSIKMAKTQNLSLNPTKISGTCGRLMCCLKYEQNAYEDAAKRMPKNDSFVDTPDGLGNVSNVDLLREQVTVRLDESPESPKKYKNTEIRVLRNGKGSREGIEIPSHRPSRHVPTEAAAPVEESRPSRRVVLSHDVPVSVPADTAAAEAEKQEHSGNRRRHRAGRKPSGEKVKVTEKQIKEVPAAKEAVPKQEKPAKQEKPKVEKKPDTGRNHKRPTKPAKAEQGEKVEKVAVRTVSDTTAEKKAAADRAARQQTGEAHTAENKNHRHRPRHRHRPKKSGGGQGEAQ